MRLSRVHCAVLNARTRPLVRHVHSVTAAMARGKRPVTFRTRKLSLPAPMVLPRRRGGRVGRRRTTIPEGAPTSAWGPLRHAPTLDPPREKCPLGGDSDVRFVDRARPASARGESLARVERMESVGAHEAGDFVVRARRVVLPDGIRAAAVHTL